ncbi:MAG: glycosyltransferase [Pyrinomonadaceae bacterium]
MRILQICSARTLGGGERHLIDLTNALARRGHAMFAALATHSPLLTKLDAVPPENITRLRMRNALDLPSALRLAQFVRKHHIEIVHAHIARDYPLAALAARFNTDTRFVITRHVLFPINKLHALTLSNASGIIAVSKAVARSLDEASVCDKRRITVIPNGIDVQKFARERQRVSHDEPTDTQTNAPRSLRVGTIGHLAPIKGHEDFIRAAGIISARRTDVEFLIIGEDKSHTGEHRARLEQLIDELKLNARVSLTGWVDDPAPLLHSLDVFVSAARTEPFGLVIVEAMASGLPVVATMSEGAREIIEDGATGKLVPVGDPQALAAAIDALLVDAPQRAELGERARLAALANFSLERMVDATERVYEKALAPK